MIDIRLEKPGLRHERVFLAAVRRSRRLHKGVVTPPSTAERYRQYLSGLRKESREGFLVVTEGNDIAGVINVSEIVRGSFQSAYLGFYALVPFAGRGLMCRGLQNVLGYCFGSMRLHRVEANIQPTNERSIGSVKRLGFRLEGFSPRYLKVCGRWRDHERWAILREEWSPQALEMRSTTP